MVLFIDLYDSLQRTKHVDSGLKLGFELQFYKADLSEKFFKVIVRISDLKLGDKGVEDMRRLCSCVN